MYERYEALRNERGMTDADVSRETGITPAALCDWHNGRTKVPKVENLAKIAKLFHVPLERLLEDQG